MKMDRLTSRSVRPLTLLLASVITIASMCTVPAAADDLHIDGTQVIGDQIARIYMLLRRTPGGTPLQDPSWGMFLPIDAFFDTGASGVLLSRETRELLSVAAEPGAQFVDVGIGGEEIFLVSEPLYVAMGDYYMDDPLDDTAYHEDLGPWRLQLTKEYTDSIIPLDVAGIPAMAGKVIVFTTSSLFEGLLLAGSIKEPNDPEIPAVDFEVKVEFTNYLNRSHPSNSGPLPVLGYNPVIQDVEIVEGALSSTGDWLFDTAGTISMISGAQGHQLGLTEPNGFPIVEPAYYVSPGGIGGQQTVPVYQIDSLTVQTMNGFNLVYDNPYVAVANIATVDEDTGLPVILEGVFGTNLLDLSYDPDLIHIVDGPYDHIVFDTQRAVVGFDVKDVYPVPPPLPNQCGDSSRPWPAGDITRDCIVDVADLAASVEEWLGDDCSWLNWYCSGGDVNRDGRVDLEDVVCLALHWLAQT